MSFPITIYAVLNLDYVDDDELLFTLTNYFNNYKTNKKRQGHKKRAVNVTVVGAADKNNANYLSVLLERVLNLLNFLSEPNIKFKNFVLLDKNRHGKALSPIKGYTLASDSPPADVSGRVVFLSQRPYLRALFKDNRSWWGSTVGRLRSLQKWTTIR